MTISDDQLRDARPDDQSTDAWDQFEGRLRVYLLAMTDPDEDDHLVIEVPGTLTSGGTTPYAQVAGFGDGRALRAEFSSNKYLDPDRPLASEQLAGLEALGWQLADEDDDQHHMVVPRVLAKLVAKRIVAAFRDVVGLPHPSLLIATAWGPAAQHLKDLGLTLSEDMPDDVVDASPKALPAVRFASGRDELVGLVGAWLARRFADDLDGGPVPIDGDGDFVLQHNGGTFWVRVWPTQPAVLLMACVVPKVRSRRQTAVELSLLNRDHFWTQWALRDRSVWLTLPVLAIPWSPDGFEEMLKQFLTTLSATTSDLQARVGGVGR